MSATDDAARILTLIPWLVQRPGASVAEAAAAMGATEEQIRRDLHRVDYCGLPGLKGGDLMEVIWYEDRVILQLPNTLDRPLKPTPGETVRMILAAETVIAASAEPPSALVSALAKLRTAAGVDPEEIRAVADSAPWLDELRAALAGTTCVEIDYQGREDDAPRTRMVDPWRLELHDGRWYLHGRDVAVDEGRVFRLDRLSGVTPTDRARGAVPDELPTPTYRPEDEVAVTIRANASARWLASAFDGVTEREDGDEVVLEFGSDSLRHVAALVARAAGGGVALAPPALRQMVHEHAARALSAYGSAPSA